MLKILSFIGILFVLGFVAFLETSTESYKGFRSSLHDAATSEDAAEAISEVEHEYKPARYTSSEYIFDDAKVENGYRLETYREYEIHEDDEGNIIKKVPTSNYNYLRYKID
ncbi:hypothetical protein [Oceanobacillus saliphilus]|uniref:hypothetical protein n=1 Tax=Oceanobacillus saliphilus TaxID=2925834 RepID=UPI00201E4AA9|nr:hypothetical protein [Oceanobacillus saliphilus]